MRAGIASRDARCLARFLGHLDELNVKLIKEVFRKGPRNLSAIARSLNAPKRTIHARFVRLKRNGLLSVHALPAFHRLGLMSVVVLLDVRPGYEDALERVLKRHDYLYRFYRIIGRRNGVYAHFTIPVERVKDFEKYLETLEETGLVKDYDMVYTTDFVAFLSNFDYFDAERKIWIFDVDAHLRNLEDAEEESVEFGEPESYRIEADFIDVLIVHELQKDATTRLASIARMQRVSRSLVKYHFDAHTDGKLITQYLVLTPKFAPFTTGHFLFDFEFEDTAGLERFSYAMANTPYILLAAKELRRPRVLVELEMPIEDLERKVSRLIRELSRPCCLAKYSMSYMQASSHFWRPVPLSLFDDEKRCWVYKADRYSEELERLG